jgi:PAS domain S-box-containing protein
MTFSTEPTGSHPLAPTKLAQPAAAGDDVAALREALRLAEERNAVLLRNEQVLRERLRLGEEEMRALANAMPQLAWIAGRDGNMIWCNERWYAYTGTAPDQLGGAGWPSVYAPDCQPQLTARWQASLASGQPFEMEVPIRGADGQYRWFLTRANPVRDAAGQALRWFGTSTDVDQVKRVQEALRDETAVLELLNSTGNALASTRELPPLLQEVTDAATRISGARFGAFYYHSGDAEGAPHMLHALAGNAPDQFAGFGRPRASALFGTSLRGEGTVRSNDLSRDPRYVLPIPGAGEADGAAPAIRSYLAVPVISRTGEVVGSLYFGHPEPDMFTERTERIIGGIAAQAAVAIDNARLYAAAQHAAEERKILLDSERCARAEAERTSRLKDEFLATLSHELRTPLTAILGWAQVLRRGSRDLDDLQRGLQTIERNARAQAQLIEDLLDMSRITSGKVRLEVQVLAPQAIAEAAIDAVQPAADARQIRIERRFDPQAGPVAADPSRLQQIIWNLLSNALKFSERDGRVTVRVGQADGQLEIAVSDDGLGIRAEFLAHVFERFRQGDASTTRRHGGLGLGLAIVKHLVEQHGGTISAASDGEGHGACFTVRLPLAQPALPAATAPAARAAAPLATAGASRISL